MPVSLDVKIRRRLIQLGVNKANTMKRGKLTKNLKLMLGNEAYNIFMFCNDINVKYLNNLSKETLIFFCTASEYVRKNYSKLNNPNTYLITKTLQDYCNEKGIINLTRGKWYVYNDGSCYSNDICKKIRKLLRDNFAYFKLLDTEDNKGYLDTVLPTPTPKPPYIIKNGLYFGSYKELSEIFDNKNEINIPFTDYTVSTDFTADEMQNYLCYIYLLARHSNITCVNIQEDNYTYNTFSLFFIEETQHFEGDHEYWQKWRDCAKNNNKRFITSMLVIVYTNGMAHANIIIYDKHTKELERYDPNTFTPGGNFDAYKMGEIIDKKIVQEFKQKLGKLFVKKYIPPENICPIIGIQFSQGFENEQLKTDPGGFCAAWSVWYGDLRFSNPNMNRVEILELATKKLKDNPKSLTTFIRGYSNFLEQLKRKFLSTSIEERPNLIKYWIEKYGGYE